MRIMLAGQIGRDAAIATRLAEEGNELHIIAGFDNPTLAGIAEEHGSFYPVPSLVRPYRIASLASRINPDLVWINDDNMLARNAAGIIKSKQPEVLIASPDARSARIEWDKVFARQLIEEIDVEWGTAYNPLYRLVGNRTELHEAMDFFCGEDIEVAVKPQGLTGGKGVKVMGPHLDDYEAASHYAAHVLDNRYNGEYVLLEERLEGYEFTVQAFTDGRTIIPPPTTYDYPYRYDGDTGPGTGGMGSFTMPGDEQLPFLSQEKYNEALRLMEKVLEKLDERGLDFKGVLYGSFFMTPKGLKVVEFNARAGDPELINILELLEDDVSLTDVLGRIATRELRPQDVRFRRLASAVLYLVSPDYAKPGRTKQYEFQLRNHLIKAHDCRTYFAGAEQIGLDRYQTVGSSRTVAIAARGKTPWDARAKIDAAMAAGVDGPLESRRDVGDEAYVKRLKFMGEW